MQTKGPTFIHMIEFSNKDMSRYSATRCPRNDDIALLVLDIYIMGLD